MITEKGHLMAMPFDEYVGKCAENLIQQSPISRRDDGCFVTWRISSQLASHSATGLKAAREAYVREVLRHIYPERAPEPRKDT